MPMILHNPLATVTLVVLVVCTGCVGETETPEPAPPPEGLEVTRDTARLPGFATVTANASGHARVLVRQPEPAHTAWLQERGFRFRTFVIDTAAVQPDTNALLPDSLRFERDLAPGTLVYTRGQSPEERAKAGDGS